MAFDVHMQKLHTPFCGSRGDVPTASRMPQLLFVKRQQRPVEQQSFLLWLLDRRGLAYCSRGFQVIRRTHAINIQFKPIKHVQTHVDDEIPQ